jgi:hypothetical protein
MSQAIAPTDASGGLLNFIERASRDPEFDVAKFGELLRMQREIVEEQARRAFNVAMAEAQAEMMPIIRDAINPHTQSKYAKLETIDREMRPIYTRHGFAVRFGSAPSPNSGWIRIVCTVSHTGGYSETNYLDAPPDDKGARGGTSKTGVQAVGSAVTYLRRYLLAMVFNIVLADDDDGEGTRPTGTTSSRQKPPGNEPSHLAPLDEQNGTVWLKNLDALLAQATTMDQLVEIVGHRSVHAALAAGSGTPMLIRERINDMLLKADKRLRPAADEKPTGDWETDPVQDLLLEVEQMDAITLASIGANAAWRAKVREAAQIPQDEDRINEAIEARKLALKQGGSTQ